MYKKDNHSHSKTQETVISRTPAFRSALLAWYTSAQRTLPWRINQDPYRVWLSEIMLQQTRVDQAIPYYERFLAQFPTVHALAEANLQEVLKAWEGLGYYSRARNLHQAARTIQAQGWPQDYQGWRSLSGVGDYTARAVGSIVLDLSVGAVDGNVRRVYSRLLGIETFRPSDLQVLADSLVDPVQPGAFNQALMDLGSSICTPQNPRCLLCPIRDFCEGYAQGRIDELPAKVQKAAIPHRQFLVILHETAAGIYIRQRPEKGLLGGLWELPNVEIASEISSDVEVQGLTPNTLHTKVEHRYTHFQSTLWVYEGQVSAELQSTCILAPWKELEQYPFSRAFQKVFERRGGPLPPAPSPSTERRSKSRVKSPSLPAERG
jgi:A/G-specific adenine glycosylase